VKSEVQSARYESEDIGTWWGPWVTGLDKLFRCFCLLEQIRNMSIVLWQALSDGSLNNHSAQKESYGGKVRWVP